MQSIAGIFTQITSNSYSTGRVHIKFGIIITFLFSVFNLCNITCCKTEKFMCWKNINKSDQNINRKQVVTVGYHLSDVPNHITDNNRFIFYKSLSVLCLFVIPKTICRLQTKLKCCGRGQHSTGGHGSWNSQQWKGQGSTGSHWTEYSIRSEVVTFKVIDLPWECVR